MQTGEAAAPPPPAASVGAAREPRSFLNAGFAAKLAPSFMFIDLNSAHGFNSSAALAANNRPKPNAKV